ncbi:DUF5134 domain-containing protein [Nocardioides sp. NPDC047086]|uniref:DUF5134 domain-containing protein n=1 Tax=Nocardioides sp. NPDC047086 TaxID=3154810 RepID=UPI003408794D
MLTGTAGIWILVVCPPSGTQTVLHLNHAVMSGAMILMIWVIVSAVAVWAQVALFAALSLALLPGLRRAGGRAHRADLAGHLALNAAMIWMLAAMPLLMTGMTTPSGHGHAGHGHAGHGGAAAVAGHTPGWAIAVNSLFVVVCVAGVLWWLLRATAVREHRLPALGHGLMAAGMGTMLALLPT